MTTADVVIVGSGPGGASAARSLAGSGLEVLVLERARLPRYKPCGGAVPTGALGAPIDPEARVPAQVNLFQGGRPHHHSFDDRPILMYNRRELDFGLVGEAVEHAAGDVRIRDEFSVRSVEERPDSVLIRSESGELVKAAFVIAADGATSLVARSLGLRQRTPMAAAIDLEVRVSDACFERESARAVFDFFCLPDGYGWTFPKAGYLSCGVLAWRNPRRMRWEVDRFLSGRLARSEIQGIEFHGHPIPGYCGDHPIATSRVCLVGDAARLVDPIIGEGIRYALQSGGMAARAVLDCLAGADPPEGMRYTGSAGPGRPSMGERYQWEVRQRILPKLDWIWRFGLTAFLGDPSFFYGQFVERLYKA